ncbi:hypothetical protein Jab_2c29640 [Janthinobacterium sp. HH01]|uniref:hypothetical protein n=1 Tax=Janthinobacterium sp. HH01 TaxID=1198452 RepID=UPI0002AEB678|nr:hypothetical protein [Janthinobacterium sp. HH01]ELX10863.1 hypothetical protein Jab_2c29640 [Janthinobacterium sp. HH01]
MRKIVIGAAAVATLIAAWFAPDQDGGVVGPAAATAREADPAPAAPVAAPRLHCSRCRATGQRGWH